MRAKNTLLLGELTLIPPLDVVMAYRPTIPARPLRLPHANQRLLQEPNALKQGKHRKARIRGMWPNLDHQPQHPRRTE